MIAKNGAAIIRGEVVPAAEVMVLRTLVQLGRPGTVPEIAAAMNDAMSDATLYSLLNRLAAKRGLVTREVVVAEVFGTKLRRVMWSPHTAATEMLGANRRELTLEDAKDNQGTEVPAGTSRKRDQKAGRQERAG